MLDTQHRLEDDFKKELGDCDIPTAISKRKTELASFVNKYERLKKEFQNLKKASKKADGATPDEKVVTMVKEVEFKLKIIEKDRSDLVKSQSRELDQIQPVDYDDLEKNHEILKTIRGFKSRVEEASLKLDELEEIESGIVKRLTEQDLENSTDLLQLKANDLRDRLQEAKERLIKIQASGEEMDGNTSTNEEEDFVLALRREMPEVLENMETHAGLLKETEKLVPEIKQTMSFEKMNELREKVNIATENVEESESLVKKLEKEILEWNTQKKLCKRDQELEEVKHLCLELIEDLTQEGQNTEIELQRNREKQEENRGQEMVDKDGNKVDIVNDLVKLEGEMENYIADINLLLGDLT